MKTKPVKELSIQINLNGLSFCILNKQNSTLEFLKSIPFEKKEQPNDALSRLKTIIDTNTIFDQDFQKITCIYQNELACIVPEPIFDEGNLADYLKFNAKILRNDFISHDKIASLNAVNVYVPLVNFNNYIFEKFGSFTYKHSSGVLIESLMPIAQNMTSNCIYVHINANSFELLIFKNGDFKFYNSFQFQTVQDFIYYLLFTVEQMDLDVETLKLYFLGQVEKDDEIYNIAYTYIRHIHLLNYQPNYKKAETLEKQNLLNYYLILNSFD